MPWFKCTISHWTLYQIGCIHFMYIGEIYLVQIAFMKHFYNNFVVKRSYNAFVLVDLHIQTAWWNLDTWKTFLMKVAWSNCLIGIKCWPIRSHVLSYFRIHDLIAHVLGICYILHCKRVIIILLCIFALSLSLFFCILDVCKLSPTMNIPFLTRI